MVMMKYKMLTDFILILLIMASYCHADNSKQRLDIKKHLKSFNKHAFKSIKSPDGDIIDCIAISKQPAFDHPSLQNHTIQMRPNYHPEELSIESKMSILNSRINEPMAITQLWHNSGRCPKGTIPIIRTKEEDILRASSNESYGKKNLTSIRNSKSVNFGLIDNNGHEYAIASVKGDKYFGTKATINVWKPQIQQPDEFSLSQIWISDGSFDLGLSTVEAGWIVYPKLFGDNNPRFFTYWTSDGYNATGCYNLKCSGFIQTNKKIVLGGSITPISGYQGSQFQITILIWKDPDTRNWWLQYGNYTVGYWPASLFPHLQQGASMIEWGGQVVNTQSDGHHTTTQMGSGHFPDEGFGKASFFKNIQIVDASNKPYSPQKLSTYAGKPDCYNIQLRKQSKESGTYFYYGGPGRNPKCP